MTTAASVTILRRYTVKMMMTAATTKFPFRIPLAQAFTICPTTTALRAARFFTISTMENSVVSTLKAKLTHTEGQALQEAKHWSVQLLNLLDSNKQLHVSFATTSCLEPPPLSHPMISVEGVGTIGFPLMKCAVETVKAAATKAPFGLGNETLLDDTVRDAWQIEASKVIFGGGKIWDDFLKKVIIQACFGLGISNKVVEAKGIHANLYKMLLYETGGHFAPHRDAEKEDGMFGTLIVQLPSAYTGGDITVTHGGHTKTISLFQESDSNYHAVAFFADCEHQLHPVTSGARLCLVFNLVALPNKKVPKITLKGKTEAALNSIVEKWKAGKHSAVPLGYQLGHHYTPNSFRFSNLKGKDDFILNQLLCAKGLDGRRLFEVTLVLMEREITKYFDGDDTVEDDNVRARLVIDSNGHTVDYRENWMYLYKRDNGWMTPKDTEIEDDDECDEDDKCVNDVKCDEDDKNDDGNVIRSELEMEEDVECDKHECDEGEKFDDEEEDDDEEEKEDDDKEEDDDEEGEEDNDKDEEQDEYGNVITSEHEMFRGVTPEHEEAAYIGNENSDEIYRYYAAAVVFSLASNKP
jgi:2OG-Fe(II) oxygenase superfamily